MCWNSTLKLKCSWGLSHEIPTTKTTERNCPRHFVYANYWIEWLGWKRASIEVLTTRDVASTYLRGRKSWEMKGTIEEWVCVCVCRWDFSSFFFGLCEHCTSGKVATCAGPNFGHQAARLEVAMNTFVSHFRVISSLRFRLNSINCCFGFFNDFITLFRSRHQQFLAFLLFQICAGERPA
jgi:hypothetical protein